MPRRMPHPPHRLPALLLCGALAALAGCATKPPASDQAALQEYEQNNDPLEPTNRFFYSVNNALDTAILAPAARAYRWATPTPVRNHVHNMLDNMSTPVAFVNDVFEGTPRRAGNNFMRMIINTTVGVGGLFDVATGWGYPSNDADFGITMGVWGVPSGPFLFLPVLGPSGPRDAAGFAADIAISPFTYPSGHAWTIFSWSKYGLSAVDARERRLDQIDQIKKTALDPYATFRSLYQQFRASQIETASKDLPHTVPAWYPTPHQEQK